MPIVKREEDKKALIEAVISGNENFFLGTDSAPHGLSDKENSCGCAGIYTSPVALELYTEIFYQMKAMNKLEAFTSKNGAKHYKLPLNSKKIQLIRQEQKIPKSYLFDKELLVPFKAEETIFWKIEKNH